MVCGDANDLGNDDRLALSILSPSIDAVKGRCPSYVRFQAPWPVDCCNVMPISRYIAVAMVRCSCACPRLPARR